MTEAGRGRRLAARTAIALVALAAATDARAACPGNATPNHIFASAGDSCPFASGAYTPTVVSPFGNVVGLYAQDGGSITNAPAATSVTIHANPNGSFAILSNGASASSPFAASSINLAVPVTITTAGTTAAGVYAQAGGSVTLSDGGSITLETTSPSRLAYLRSASTRLLARLRRFRPPGSRLTPMRPTTPARLATRGRAFL
jgi:hypothetical protein